MQTRHLFPLYDPPRSDDLKDPCLVHDGTLWHIFGSGGDTDTERWGIHHATSRFLKGPWTEHPTFYLPIHGSGVAAPGVLYDAGHFHMFIQTEFMKEGGTIEYVISQYGNEWSRVGTMLKSTPGSAEAGIYDPHPAIINGQKVITYSAMPPFMGKPNPEIFLAVSESNEWYGPWKRMGRILSHADVAEHHNQPGHENYEWGIEGPQLIELPDGRVLLNAVCFLPQGMFGTRQRVFLAVADQITGPYRSLGPFIPTSDGENGHASVALVDDEVVLCYQARPHNRRWRYGIVRDVVV